MITRFGMAPRLPTMSVAEAVEHWRTSHADAAGRIPGLRTYVQLHPVLVDGALPLPYPGFDACSMLEFDDVDAMDAGFASPTYQQDVRADEADFVDKTRFSLIVTEGDTRREPAGPVVLVTFWRRHPGVDAQAFREVFSGAYAEAVSGDVGYQQYLPVVRDGVGRQRQACDGIDLVWFEDAQDGLTWLTAGAGLEAHLALAGTTFGAVRLLARPHVVV